MIESSPSIKLNILFFGLIAEAINSTDEKLELTNSISVSELKTLLSKKYKQLTKLNYQIAINQKLSSEKTIISSNSEIALLPPFAGG